MTFRAQAYNIHRSHNVVRTAQSVELQLSAGVDTMRKASTQMQCLLETSCENVKL